MPDKEKSVRKLEEFFKKTLEEVFRAFSTQCGAKRYLLRLCILMRMCPRRRFVRKRLLPFESRVVDRAGQQWYND